MSDIPTMRREQIIQWLQKSQSLSIEDLVARLGVSPMTVHRDLDALVEAGQAIKVHGGVKLMTAPVERSVAACQMCQIVVPERTAFVVHTVAGETLEACCPHCGLMLMRVRDDVATALAKDFIYGRMVNSWHATYLVGCDINLCCTPSVLCFATPNDARRFRMGFGGEIMTFDGAQDFLMPKRD